MKGRKLSEYVRVSSGENHCCQTTPVRSSGRTQHRRLSTISAIPTPAVWVKGSWVLWVEIGEDKKTAGAHLGSPVKRESVLTRALQILVP